MITNQQLASLIQDKLNGAYSPEHGEFENIRKYGLDKFSPNVRYEFKIFASDGEYQKAENRDALISPDQTNTVTVYINGVLRTPGGSPVEGVSAQTINTAIESQIELLIPNCDDDGTFTSSEDENQSVSIRFQDLIYLIVQDVLSIPSDNALADQDDIMYFVGARFTNASIGDRRNRSQAGLSVILSMFITFSVVALGISSRQIKLNIEGEDIYFNRISISRTSTQEVNVSAKPSASAPTLYGVSRARTSATHLVIAFSAPVRPTALNDILVRYILTGEVQKMDVKLTIPTKTEGGELQSIEGDYKMTFAEGGIAGEENLNAAYDIRLVEEMEDANG